MRVAILTNNLPSFNRVMADGLQRMLRQIGLEATVYDDGHDRLRKLNRSEASRAGRLLWQAKFLRFLASLRGVDLIVLVSTVPKAFLRTDHARLETLRRWLPRVPIVNYDVSLLPTQAHWLKVLQEGNHPWVPEGGQFGLERFDWYLTVANRSYSALPQGEWPVTTIGLNLDDGTLYPGQKQNFLAIIDFEQPEYLRERVEQILALEEASIPYVVLHGSYRIDEIRAVYREASLYLLASPESFGLPICEMQACGAYIFTRQADWCAGHWLDGAHGSANTAKLSSNFIVYHDKATLVRQLIRMRREYNAQQVVETFMHYQPHFYFGDLTALRSFCQQVRSSAIHARLHLDHMALLD